jgi:hypothetical protein
VEDLQGCPHVNWHHDAKICSGQRWVFEFKRSTTPVPTRGLHEGCRDLLPERKLIVYPGDDGFPLGEGVEAVGVAGAMELLRQARTDRWGWSMPCPSHERVARLACQGLPTLLAGLASSSVRKDSAKRSAAA